MNCLLPIKSEGLNDEVTEIYTNSIISVLVIRYNVYLFGNVFNLLFSHLVEAKGFNSLICIKKYA